MVITMAKLRMAHASTHGARKPPGPKEETRERERAKVGDNNGQATHDACKHASRTQAAWANSLYCYLLCASSSRKLNVVKKGNLYKNKSASNY